MPLEIEINHTAPIDAAARAAGAANYVNYAPAPCRIRQTGAAEDCGDDGPEDVSVLLRSTAQAGGGRTVFYTSPAAKSRRTLRLSLPGDGSWVEFWMGGRFGYPSADDRDCTLVASGGGERLSVQLMVRVRKNANDLLPRERDRFLNAWKVLNDGGNGKFQAFRDMHTAEATEEEHRGPHFLPWHRSYLLDLEREMQAIDPSVSLHYWRFDEPAPNVFRSNFMGATQQVDETTGEAHQVTLDPGHPLSGWVTDGTPGILRSAIFNTQTSAAPGPTGFAMRTQAETLALSDVFFNPPPPDGSPPEQDFSDMEGTPHGAAHVSFIGDIDFVPTAPKDPLFFMLHANVDRLWALWQWVNKRTDPDDAAAYTGEDRDGRRLDDTLWPWNDVTTDPRPDFAPRTALAGSQTVPEPGTTPKLRDMIDYQGHNTSSAQIGFGYDDVPYEFE